MLSAENFTQCAKHWQVVCYSSKGQRYWDSIKKAQILMRLYKCAGSFEYRYITNLSMCRVIWIQIYTERKKKRRVNFIPNFFIQVWKSLLNILLWLQNGTSIEQKFQISLVCDQQVSSYWSSLVATPQILKSKSNWKSISGVPPLAAVAALILFWIELTKALTVRIGILFHSSINAFLNCARVAGGFRRFLTLLSSSSHMCSIGVKSGLYGGHASGAMLLFARKSWQTRATCGRVLSCCRIR